MRLLTRIKGEKKGAHNTEGLTAPLCRQMLLKMCRSDRSGRGRSSTRQIQGVLAVVQHLSNCKPGRIGATRHLEARASPSVSRLKSERSLICVEEASIGGGT